MRLHETLLLQNVALGVISGSAGEQQKLAPLGASEDDMYFAPEGVVAPNLEDYVGAIMKEWHVPGMAIAVINGNETWSKGFGHAILPDTPVTPCTLFYTGSTTKSMTAAALSLLIDNSSSYSDISWTTPISHLLREDFVLSDEWATAHITIEDALSHRTGYPRHDIAVTDSNRASVRNLRNLPMSAEPRAAYQYCNKMYGVAGYLIETLTGTWLGAFFHSHLWGPIGMNETFLGLQDTENSGLLLAGEYYYHDAAKRYIALPHTASSDVDGAGSAISTVLDYARYLRTMMAEAGPVSRAGHRELKRPRIIAGTSAPFVGYVSYALGWLHGVFGGEETYTHTGQTNWFTCTMIMVPSKQFGIVVFQNSDPPSHQVVAYKILYDLFKVPEADRIDLNAQYKAAQQANEKYIATCAERLYPYLPDPPLLPTLPLANHIGEYREAGYGNATVALECVDDGDVQTEAQCQLSIRLGQRFGALNVVVNLEHMSGDFWLGRARVEEFSAEDAVLACAPVHFRFDASGAVSHFGVDVRQEGDDAPLVWFERVGG